MSPQGTLRYKEDNLSVQEVQAYLDKEFTNHQLVDTPLYSIRCEQLICSNKFILHMDYKPNVKLTKTVFNELVDAVDALDKALYDKGVKYTFVIAKADDSSVLKFIQMLGWDILQIIHDTDSVEKVHGYVLMKGLKGYN